MRGYVWWMLVATACVIFVMAVRVGPVHVAAWAEPCKSLRSGEAIEGLWPDAYIHCKDFNPRGTR